MNGFTEIYSENDRRAAKSAVGYSLLIFVAVTAVFVGLCAAFVVLYFKHETMLYLSFTVNFIITVAFVWFTVIFFCEIFSEKRERLRFYGILDNAVFEYYTGTFTGTNGFVKLDRVEYDKYRFESEDGQRVLLLMRGAVIPFRTGRTYDVAAVGDRVTAYKEADNG